MANRKSGILLHPSSCRPHSAWVISGRRHIPFLIGSQKPSRPSGRFCLSSPPMQAAHPIPAPPPLPAIPCSSAELLLEEGLLSEADLQNASVPPAARVDYEKAAAVKLPLLEKAFQAFQQKEAPADYAAFQAEMPTGSMITPLYCAEAAFSLRPCHRRSHGGLRPVLRGMCRAFPFRGKAA